MWSWTDLVARGCWRRHAPTQEHVRNALLLGFAISPAVLASVVTWRELAGTVVPLSSPAPPAHTSTTTPTPPPPLPSSAPPSSTDAALGTGAAGASPGASSPGPARETVTMLDGTLLAVAIILGLAITTALVIGVALRRSRRRAPAVAPPTDANADGASEPIGELTDDAPADMAPSPARPESLPQEEQPRGLPGGRPEGAVGWLDRDIAAMAAGPPRRRRATDDTRLVLFDRADGHDGSQQAAPPRLRIAVDWDGHTNWLMSSTLDARGFLGHVVAGAAGGTPPVGTAVRASTHLDGTSLTAPGEVTSSTLGPRGPVLSVSFTELDGEQRALLTRLSPEGTR